VNISRAFYDRKCRIILLVNNRLIKLTNLMFVDPCIIVQFLQRKTQQDATVYQNFIILILKEAQRVSGDTTPIIRSPKLHKQPLVLHNTEEVCRTCSCWTLLGSVCLCSFRLLMIGDVSPETC